MWPSGEKQTWQHNAKFQTSWAAPLNPLKVMSHHHHHRHHHQWTGEQVLQVDCRWMNGAASLTRQHFEGSSQKHKQPKGTKKEIKGGSEALLQPLWGHLLRNTWVNLTGRLSSCVLLIQEREGQVKGGEGGSQTETKQLRAPHTWRLPEPEEDGLIRIKKQKLDLSPLSLSYTVNISVVGCVKVSVSLYDGLSFTVSHSQCHKKCKFHCKTHFPWKQVSVVL